MATYKIGGQVKVSGSFTIDLADRGDLARWVRTLERDPLEALQQYTESTFDADDSEVDDISELVDGKWRAVELN